MRTVVLTGLLVTSRGSDKKLDKDYNTENFKNLDV